MNDAGDKRRETSSSCELGNDAADEAGQQGKMLATRLDLLQLCFAASAWGQSKNKEL